MEITRILIVDDLLEVRQGLATVLELAAKTSRLPILVVGFAQDGADALAKAASLRPDVVLMDLEMPVMDGIEATRHFKAELPSARVIILTIHAGAEIRARAIQAGAASFLIKGAEVQALVNAILGRDGSNHSEKGEIK